MWHHEMSLKEARHPQLTGCYLCSAGSSLCPPAPPAARHWPGRTPMCTVGPSAGIWSGPSFPPSWFQSPSAAQSAPQGRAGLRKPPDLRSYLAEERRDEMKIRLVQRENYSHKWEIKRSLLLFAALNALRPRRHICCYEFITIANFLSWLPWDCFDSFLSHWPTCSKLYLR